MTHYDGWLGREWLPTRRSRVVGDVWASGYSRTGAWQSGRVRAALSAEHAAASGLWRLTGAAEQLSDPDPDVRALSISDRALAFVPRRVRFAESAPNSVSGANETSSPDWLIARDSMPPCSAPSRRGGTRSPSASPTEDFSVSVVGLGLALSPRRPGRATIRLDYGVPLSAPAGVKRTPRLSITLMPWLEASRHRDGSESY